MRNRDWFPGASIFYGKRTGPVYLLPLREFLFKNLLLGLTMATRLSVIPPTHHTSLFSRPEHAAWGRHLHRSEATHTLHLTYK